MRAVRDVVEHYSNLIRKDRRLVIVLVTDESGDDGADVEEARQALKKYKVPLYVIGRQSLFGYPFAHHRYIDPVTKDVYHPLIRRGPETADLEIYQWDGLYDRWDEQPSGFAPYELARLTKDSGGIYFVLPSEEFMRIRQREQAYSITQLKEYLPEYDNRLTYVEKRNSSPLRQMLHAIVMEGKDFIYRRDFPIESAELVKAALQEGEKAGVKLNFLLEIQKRLEGLAKVREREPEKRWQAHYDLMLAQTVAFQVKAYEYRALMASIVKAPPVPKRQPGPDLMVTWVVDHSKNAVGSQEPRPPRNTPKPSGCSSRSSPAIPRPPGRTSRKMPSTAACRSSSTSGTTTRSTTNARSSCPSIEYVGLAITSSAHSSQRYVPGPPKGRRRSRNPAIPRFVPRRGASSGLSFQRK